MKTCFIYLSRLHRFPGYQRLLPLLCLGLGLFKLPAQNCQVTCSGSHCVGIPIQFTGSIAGTTHDFDFNGESTAATQRIVNYAFKTPGNKKITYITTINGKKCTSVLNITILKGPVIKLKLLSKYQQCFEKNLYCFSDSSYSPSGVPIVSTVVVINDGETFTYLHPEFGRTFCFSFKDQRGLPIDLMVYVTDENGCFSADTFYSVGKVSPKIGASFVYTNVKNPDCDSLKTRFDNTSLIPRSTVKKLKWLWGDGTFDTSWGSTLYHTFHSSGTYDARLTIESLDGCVDSFTRYGVATVLNGVAKIISDKDSTCISNPYFTFSASPVPVGATSIPVWKFGPPPYKVDETLNTLTWNPTLVASSVGPFLVSLSYSHSVCGNRTLYDTVFVTGVKSTIEMPNNRIAENEVYQCTKDVQDSVHFKNFSTFYHADNNFLDDDSVVWVNGKPRIVFDALQQPVRPYHYNRSRNCVTRLWDFGDAFAPNCTTDITRNLNVHCNCNYSLDSLPVHYYTSWDITLLNKYKNIPMEEGIFLEASRTSKKLNVYPSDSFCIVEDSLITIPNDVADIDSASKYSGIKTKYFMQEKFFCKGARYITDYVNIQLKSGEAASVKNTAGSITKYNGPVTVFLQPGYSVVSPSSGDTVRFLFTIHSKKDTLPSPFLKLRNLKGEYPIVIGTFKKTYAGTLGQDYIINFNRYRELFYAKIPTAYTARLKQKDTCHANACENEASKQLIIMHPDAGGPHVSLRKESGDCLGGIDTKNGVKFILDDLRPGASFSYVAIKIDSNCTATNFVPITNFPTGKYPYLTAYNGYMKDGNMPTVFTKEYAAAELCSPSFCATVGLVVGNGVSRSGTKPLCSDTQWYHNFVCFQQPDANFTLNAKRNAYGIYKICRGDTVGFVHPANNPSKPHSLRSIRYELATKSAGKNYINYSESYVQENYYFNQLLKDSAANKRYNFLVITRGGDNPKPIPCSNYLQDKNPFLFRKPDTIITAIIDRQDTLADISKAWDEIKPQLESNGLDPFSIDEKTMAKMIWNRKGTIGNPATGARGFLDTIGFGSLIKIYTRPAPGHSKILHYRDTSFVPVDSFIDSGKWIKGYILFPKYNGYYVASRDMVSEKGMCEGYVPYQVIVGFGSKFEFPDSIAAQEQGNTLAIKPNFRYFHIDPIIYGNWDTTDYWRDQDRILDQLAKRVNREPFAKWDWSQADDDTSDKRTIFGITPWGGIGMGTPWVQLGGGGASALYYKKDTGVYTFRVIAGDSSGCFDTTTKRVFITKIESHFKLDFESDCCNAEVEFTDSSIIYDPCTWSRKNCKDNTPIHCDFINKWYIDWGDGTNNLLKRSSYDQDGIPAKIKHTYRQNGWYRVNYFISSDQGGADSISQWIDTKGPRPRFAFTDSVQNEITIGVNDSVRFTNLSDSASAKAEFTWVFGDGNTQSTRDTIVTHQYTQKGDFYVFLEEYDSLSFNTVHRNCPSVYPDTIVRHPLIVHVISTLGNTNIVYTNKITVFPNPTSGKVVLQGAEVASVEIFTVQGKFVGEFECKNKIVDLSSLEQGIYLMKGKGNLGQHFEVRVLVIK